MTGFIGLVGGMHNFLTVMEALIGAFIAFKVVSAIMSAVTLATNPLFLAIVGLAAVAFLIVKNWKTIGPFLQNIWLSVQAVAKPVIAWLTNAWTNASNTVKNVAQAVWPTVSAILTGAFNVIKAAITVLVAVFQIAFPTIKGLAQTAFALIKGFVDTIIIPAFKVAKWGVETILIPAFNLIKGPLADLGKLFASVFGAITTVVKTAIIFILGLFRDFLAGLGAVFDLAKHIPGVGHLFDGVSDSLTKTVGKVDDLIGALKGVPAKVGTTVSVNIDWTSGIAGAATAVISAAVRGLGGSPSSAITSSSGPGAHAAGGMVDNAGLFRRRGSAPPSGGHLGDQSRVPAAERRTVGNRRADARRPRVRRRRPRVRRWRRAHNRPVDREGRGHVDGRQSGRMGERTHASSRRAERRPGARALRVREQLADAGAHDHKPFLPGEPRRPIQPHDAGIEREPPRDQPMGLKRQSRPPIQRLAANDRLDVQPVHAARVRRHLEPHRQRRRGDPVHDRPIRPYRGRVELGVSQGRHLRPDPGPTVVSRARRRAGWARAAQSIIGQAMGGHPNWFPVADCGSKRGCWRWCAVRDRHRHRHHGQDHRRPREHRPARAHLLIRGQYFDVYPLTLVDPVTGQLNQPAINERLAQLDELIGYRQQILDAWKLVVALTQQYIDATNKVIAEQQQKLEAANQTVAGAGRTHIDLQARIKSLKDALSKISTKGLKGAALTNANARKADVQRQITALTTADTANTGTLTSAQKAQTAVKAILSTWTGNLASAQGDLITAGDSQDSAWISLLQDQARGLVSRARSRSPNHRRVARRHADRRAVADDVDAVAAGARGQPGAIQGARPGVRSRGSTSAGRSRPAASCPGPAGMPKVIIAHGGETVGGVVVENHLHFAPGTELAPRLRGRTHHPDNPNGRTPRVTRTTRIQMNPLSEPECRLLAGAIVLRLSETGDQLWFEPQPELLPAAHRLVLEVEALDRRWGENGERFRLSDGARSWMFAQQPDATARSMN